MTTPPLKAGVRDNLSVRRDTKHLIRFCEQEEITFSRTRPSRKNDNPYVEQIGLRIVHQHVTRLDLRKGPYQNAGHRSDCAADCHRFILGETQPLDVLRIDQDNIPAVLTTVQVFLFVDNGVELSLTPSGY